GIKQVLTTEEELFTRTLQAGTAQIERLIADARAQGQKRITGERAFDLYQTYGFPVELTDEMLREQGLELDREGFERELEAERRRAREAATVRSHIVADAEFGDLPPTVALAWTATEADSRILALHSDDKGSRLVLEATPFYAEGGGQVGDTGIIPTPGGVFVVEDTPLDPPGHLVPSPP